MDKPNCSHKVMCTVRQNIVPLNGASVSFEIPPINQLKRMTERHVISGVFTAENLGLSEHTYHVKQLSAVSPSQRYSITAVSMHAPLSSLAQTNVTEPILMGSPGGPLLRKRQADDTLPE